MRGRNWFWGVFFILGAILLGVSQLGLISYHIGFWAVIASVILVAALIQSVVMWSIGGTVFSLAFLSIIWAGPLGIQALVPWTVLGIAILLTIGLHIIFHRPHGFDWSSRFVNGPHRFHHHHGPVNIEFDSTGQFDDADTEYVNDQTNVHIDSRMSKSIRYINGENIQTIDITAYMTGLKVYFENADVVDDAHINIDAQLSGVELFVPRNWHLINDVGAMLSGVNDHDYSQDRVTTKNVHLTGKSSLSGLEIYYV